MIRIIQLCVLSLSMVWPTQPMANDEERWTYDGPFGPQNWGLITEDYAACGTGQQQSPIDLSNPVRTALPSIDFHWRQTDWTVSNTGHGLHVQGDQAGHIILNNVHYDLFQFHFHTPSEHTVDGENFPMAAHFVHVSQHDEIAVVAIMLEGGGRNPEFEAVMAQIPQQTNDPNRLQNFDPTNLLPVNRSMFQYQGSLTTPPCSETVLWSILVDPVTVSDAAITTFGIMFGENTRPVQPLNRRYVLGTAP